MNWLKKLFAPRVVRLHDPAWREQQRALFARLGQTPEGDALLDGIIAWQDARLTGLVGELANPKLTAEQALVLAHRVGEIADFREALQRAWHNERAKALHAAQSARG